MKVLATLKEYVFGDTNTLLDFVLNDSKNAIVIKLHQQMAMLRKRTKDQ